MQEDRTTPRRSDPTSWPMTGRDGGNVALRDADRPIPFFLTDEPIALVPCGAADREALGDVP